MANFNLDGIAIRGISCAVPDNKVNNTSFYEKFGQESVDNFIKMTGVHSTYRTAEEQTASDLCFVAADRLIREKEIKREEIEACVFISQTPDYRLPATACVLHKRLGLPKSCMAFDVNLGCSGWVYGVNIVGSLMKTANIQKALLLFGDTSVKTTCPDDKSAIMLFGEAGSATLLVKEENCRIFGELMTDGEGFKAIIMPSGAYRNRNGSHERVLWGDGNIRSDYDGYMNGTDVFSFTITQVPKMIKRHLQEENATPDQYDALLLHQANLYILQQISKKTKFPMENIPISIDRFGNTSGTSIPLTICDAYGSLNDRELHLLTCGFGIGLSWGVADIKINSGDILPITFTSEYYQEGGVNRD